MKKKFKGFKIPKSNYFEVPNVFLDEILPELTSAAEVKIMMYVFCHTWIGDGEGYKRKHITTDEFMHGLKDKDGVRIDCGTGLSNRSVIDGLRLAVEHNLLMVHVDKSNRSHIKKYYSPSQCP